MSTLVELEYEQVSPRLLELLRREGYASLTEFQVSAVEKGLIRGKNQLLVTYDYDEAYTIAEIAVLNTLAMDFRTRAIIVCPNPSITEKRVKSLRPKCHRLGIETTVIARKGFIQEVAWEQFQLIVVSFSAFSMLLKTRPKILEKVDCVLVERLDLIGQPDIGPQLEESLVILLKENPQGQIIAILPPVADIEELGNWLNAEIVPDKKANVRRIFSVKAFENIQDSLVDLTEFVYYKRGQIMILCSNIETCQKLALQLSGLVKEDGGPTLDLRLTPEEKDRLREIAADITRTFRDCNLTKQLASTTMRGITFLHEGVPRKQRRRISQAWENGEIPVLVVPTRFVIASGLKATVVFLIGVFLQELGDDISKNREVKMLTEWQLSEVLHSTGRTGIDSEGFGIVVVENQAERQRVLNTFFAINRDGSIMPRLGEVDSFMDDPENMEDLILTVMCGTKKTENPFEILNSTYWATRNKFDAFQDKKDQEAEAQAEIQILLRATNSTIKRAENIPNSNVKLVSIRPDKLEGLVKSSSRNLWHYVTLKSTEGVSCSCEAWKFQGIRQHRLCKHLVKFAKYCFKQEETKQYATSVVLQALRSLNIIDELEESGFVKREGDDLHCTPLGRNVNVLGTNVREVKQILETIRKHRINVKQILITISARRMRIPEEMIERIVNALPVMTIDEIVCREDRPGIIENIIENLHYSTILIRRFGKFKREENYIRRTQSILSKLLGTVEND